MVNGPFMQIPMIANRSMSYCHRLRCLIGAWQLALAVFATVGASCEAQDSFVIQNVAIHTATEKGIIDRGTVVVQEGKIVEVGTDVRIPVSARIIDGRGKTLTPGFIAPMHAVELQRETAGESRTVIVRGRPVTIGGRSASTNTSFVRVSENLPADFMDWSIPIRCGITTMHAVAPGHCQTMVIQPGAEPKLTSFLDSKFGQLHIALTNSSQSLELLRRQLKPPQQRGASTNESPSSGSPSTEPSVEKQMWDHAREGKIPIWITVNNAATILHALDALKEFSKVRVAWIVNGQDAYQTLNQFPKESSQLVLSPRIDLIPNTRNRVNVPALAVQRELPILLALGTRPAELNEAQAAPTFALSHLVKTGMSPERALKAVTIDVARALGMDAMVGSIEKGKAADLLLFDGSPFDGVTPISEVFIHGKAIRWDSAGQTTLKE
jgi:hypothetical protein